MNEQDSERERDREAKVVGEKGGEREMRIAEERRALDEATRHTLQQELHSPINPACAIKESVLK